MNPAPGPGGIVLPFGDQTPRIAADVFVAATAVVIGDAEIGPGSSIWFGAVVRGDVNSIRIGARTNVQDGTVVHVTHDGHSTAIGDGVTIGHVAIIHACTIEDSCLIGMGSCVMDGAVIEAGAMVAAGALVTPGKRIPTGQLWAGRPAKHMRDLGAQDIAEIEDSARHYAALAQRYRKGA